ncbi:transposase [uncultured Thiohalocapsa sp.]|uniref:transposase n=1 Tax=uncultured Thiohalocapsa sp. TaxID=768990 RepID=UPI0025D7321B|nr:transposase [uncultured Thiohalocapsa sp.]
MSESTEVLTEPKLERRTRRRFSAAEKQRLLAEADALPHGEQGAWLRRNGLYAAQLSQWRKALAEQGTQGLEPKRGGRQPADPRDREIERLRRENARLERRAQVAEDLVALQKKLSDLLEQVRSEPAP